MKNITTLFKVTLIVALVSFNSSFAQHKVPTQNVRLFGNEVEAHNVNPANGIIRCATVEYEKFLQQNDPKRMTDAEFEAWINPIVEAYKSQQAVSSQTGGIITIPVVVHVIHNGQAVGVAPNITDSQVQSQITVMNEDFRRMMGTPGYNTNPVGADTQIQFALAQEDPTGNPTNGINRVNLCQSSWSTTAINSTVKPATQWDPNLYLNMWSVNFSDQSLLGYAQFPNASGLPGLSFSGGAANTDGVVCNYATFGSINYNDGSFLLNAPYNEGRTMTHEVGHWVGLRHIWGDGNCSADDFCADTPNAGAANFGCPAGTDSCPETGLDMIENYMDYSDDDCMNIFTVDQKARMTVIMNNAARRTTLKTSTKDFPMTLFANDAEVKVESACAGPGGSCSATSPTQKATIFNRGTSNLTSATISYVLNGGTPVNYVWAGNLATHKSATFDIPIVGSNGPITLSIVNVNGGADQRASNNTSSGTYTAPTAPANYTYNNVVFRLQRDNYGSETTWNIKNAAGTTLYSGGPYTDVTGPALITQNWTLASNQCYTFTINDAYGDGICCQWGTGFYDIKSPDGTVVIASGGDFDATESKLFTINLLANEQFSLAGSIQVYPNPTRGTLNIGVGSDLGLPTAYTIFNAIGQTIATKNIVSESDLTVNTSALSTGLYFIKVDKDSQSTTLRFIKE